MNRRRGKRFTRSRGISILTTEIFSLSTLANTFGLVFLAEIGDKTQLVSMMLAARFGWKRVFPGIALAFALLSALAVFLGQIAFRWIPLGWIKLVTALFFLFVGITALRNSDESDQDGDEGHPDSVKQGRGPALTAFLMIFLAEMGDKTQLLTASIAAGTEGYAAVFLGSTLALWVISLLGMAVSGIIAKKIPFRWIKRTAGIIFLCFGAAYLIQSAVLLGWISAAALPLPQSLLNS